MIKFDSTELICFLTPKNKMEDVLDCNSHEMEKYLRYVSHKDFISKCVRHGIVPEGFKINWNIQIDCSDEILNKCEKIKQDASVKLMELTLVACEEKINKLRSDICVEHLNNEDHKLFSKRRLAELTQKKNEKFYKLLNCKLDFLSSLVTIDNFQESSIQMDGNCFYRCIAKEIYNNDNKHEIVRQKINNHMKDLKDVYKEYVDRSITKHIENHSFSDGRVESWATEAEIYAAATLFLSEICIFADDQNITSKLLFQPLNGVKTKRKIFLRLRMQHFTLLHIKLDQNKHQYLPEYERMNREVQIDWFTMESCCNFEERGHKMNYQDKKNRKTQECDTQKLKSNDKRTKNKGENKPAKKDTIETNNNSLDTVTNLSSRKLTEAETSLLSKGISFVPSKKHVDLSKIHSDLAEWERRMRLAEYFHSDENQERKNEKEEYEIKKESRFTPEPGREKWLDAYIEAVKNDILNGIKENGQSNITRQEKQALHTLLNDSSIIIRPADKGSGIVITDANEYVEKLRNELNDSTSYEKTNGNGLDNANTKVKQLANKLFKNGIISKKLQQYLIPKYPSRGKLKGNPKIHKKGNPYRTIVNGIGTSTERMAEVAEKELETYVIETPSYIRDTTAFLNAIEREITTPLPEGIILYCFDVVKLYPSIPKKEGLEACKQALNERCTKTINTEAVIEMIETVLENNVIEFCGQEYRQKEGVAIGSKLGRNYACCYMRKWDEQLSEYNKQPIFYKRFIDDGFGLWTHGIDELMKFFDYANKIHENIKVELRWNTTQIDFLDKKIQLEDNKITTDLYSKPTDKHQYVQYDSDHPTNVKKAIPYGLGIRLKRICSDENKYRHR